MSPQRIEAVRSAMEELDVFGAVANEVLEAIGHEHSLYGPEANPHLADERGQFYVDMLAADDVCLNEGACEMLKAEIASYLMGN